MNSNRGPGANPGPNDQSPLSLLVNAADSHDPPPGQLDGGHLSGRTLAETLRLRGLGGDGSSLEEQLLLQHQQQAQGHFGGPGSVSLLSSLRDQNLLSQLGQQQQLAALLGLGGINTGSDIRAALAAQMRAAQQHQQLTHADLLSLSRSGALSGLSGFLGAGSGLGGGLNAELENLQRLEEIERRQRILAATAASAPLSSAGMVRGADVREAPSSGLLSRQDGGGDSRYASADNSSLLKSSSAHAHSSHMPTTEAPAPTAADTSKEELEKAPGSVIVPCRARGMPMDHNFKTAYFVIPENVKHGEELICSYFACRNAGIKFRYCSHCKVPVAKRNFRKRHKHGGEDIKPVPGDESGDEAEVEAKGIPSQITATTRVQHAIDADGISSQSADSDHINHSPKKSGAEMEKGLVQHSMRSFEMKTTKQTESDKPVPKEIPIVEDSESERMKRWVALLGKRPSTKDGESMSAWLMEVLAVSDLETPLKSVGEALEGGGAEGKTGAKEEDQASEASDDAKERKPTSDDKPDKSEGKDENSNSSSLNGNIIRKKRPAQLLEGEDKDDKSESFVSGSFAEWKERKKQKKLSKPSSGDELRQEAL